VSTEPGAIQLEHREQARGQRKAGVTSVPEAQLRGRSDAALKRRIAGADAVHEVIREMRSELPTLPLKFRRSLLSRVKFSAACMSAGLEFVTIGDGDRQRPAFFTRKTREQVEWRDVPEELRRMV
jgi:hypothetical protein